MMRGTYTGLFFTSLAALMMEILLTRVFSVATWYYFAFFAISVAMFGFTVGALAVYLKKDFFSDEKLGARLALSALLFAITVDFALLVFLSIPFYPRFTGIGIFSTVLVYLVIALPFMFAGIVICLCLTRFPKKIGLVYAADLIGAGIGAFLVFPVLNAMDAPSGIFLVGAIGALGALFFARGIEKKEGSVDYVKVSAVIFFVLTAVMFGNSFTQAVRVEWVKKSYNKPEFELWNAFSRIAVYPTKLTNVPYSWGLSRAYKADRGIAEKMIDIDGVSETVMTLNDEEHAGYHLRYDVTSIAHYLRENAKVFIIGVGGGRDILAAKEFGQKKIVGAEINNRTLQMINEVYGDFTGHLDRLPGVTIINDEARSAITRMDEKFDIIQASCIATWSATTAGAFSLAENSLYTVEAWNIFFDRLTPNGVLSFNRWYSPDYPAQLMRMAGLASYTLQQKGVQDPGRHIVIVRSNYRSIMPSGTILISKSPFSDEDLKKLDEAVNFLKFDYEYRPGGYQNKFFKTMIDNASNPEFHNTTMVDLSPSTDDRPFFFYMIRAKDIFAGKNLKFNEQRFNAEGIKMLFVLLVVSVALCVIFIFGPLLVAKGARSIPAGGAAVGILFFAAIGFGYILVEIAQLQRLIIFLGHPIYSITVVIFAMLVSSGVGAMVSSRWTKDLKTGRIIGFMAALLALIVFSLYMQPGILSAFEQGSVFTRIMIALIFLVPMGFFMGLPFPFGMSLASRAFEEHTPWFWAINGATGVVSSVLSVCISISWGFTATLTVGLACYVLATLSLLMLHSKASKAVI